MPGRQVIADTYIQGGIGIEIGALHMPLRVTPKAKVIYVDRASAEELSRHYPPGELHGQPIIPIDRVDDGERLTTFADGSLDFVIANHFLEHTEDPIGTLKTFARVLRSDGIAYLALPDKTQTFDRTRDVTTLRHLIDDHVDGGRATRKIHFLEWATYVEAEIGRPKSPTEAAQYAAKLDAANYSIHFHVWDMPALIGFLGYVVDTLPLTLLCLSQFGDEMILALRRR